jgi:hypothetical protein
LGTGIKNGGGDVGGGVRLGGFNELGIAVGEGNAEGVGTAITDANGDGTWPTREAIGKSAKPIARIKAGGSGAFIETDLKQFRRGQAIFFVAQGTRHSTSRPESS